MTDTFTRPQTAPRRLASALFQLAGRQIAYLRIRTELETMDARTLADLGLSRADLNRVARQHADAA